MRTFRSILRFLVPSWLYEGEGGKVVQSHTLVIDETMDRARAGLEARFPSRAQDDALALIGADRGIPRGRTELASHYAQRLIGWRYPRGHRVRGSAFALLNQISEYFGGLYCWSIDVRGNRHVRTAANAEFFSYGFAWNWDGTTSPKGCFWVVIEPPVTLMSVPPSLGDPALWGGALGTPGYSIGQIGAAPEDRDAIKNLFDDDIQWRPSGTLPQWLIVNLDATAHSPDGTWATWSKVVSGTRSASRYTGWRYWALFEGVNDYTPVPANATTTLLLPDGTTYTAVAASAHATITLPDGTVYTPVAANARARINLVDDGDQP